MFTDDQAPGRRILLVEDDERIVRMLTRYLEERGYLVRGLPDALNLAHELRVFAPDLLLLDWSLPGKTGIEALRELRTDTQWSSLAVIMLTVRNEELDRVEGLLTGADDYMSKPFSLAELEARIQSVLRRYRREASGYADERLQIVPEEKILQVNGNKHVLSLHEWALLSTLLEYPEGVSRQTLIRRIWGKAHSITPRAIDVMVLRLRRILEEDPTTPRYILTERGVGYRFYRHRPAGAYSPN